MSKLMDLREDIKYSLADYIPILEIIDNKVFLEDMTASVIIKVSFIYDEVLNDEKLVEIKEKIMNFLNSLEPNLLVKFYFKKDQSFHKVKEKHLNVNKSKKNIVKELFKREVNQIDKEMDNKALFNYNLYVEIRKKFDIGIDNPKNLIYSDQKLSNKNKNKLLDVINQLKDIENKYSLYLEKVGMNVKSLSEQETIDLLASHINLSPMNNVNFTIKDDLIHSDMNIKYDYLLMNGKYAGFVTFKREPEIVFPSIIKYLCRADLNFEYDIILNIKMFNKYKEQKKLKRKKRITRALKFDLFSDDIDENQQAVENNISNLLTDMVSGKENLFSVEPLILVKGDSEQELKDNIEDMISSIRQLEGAEGFKESNANFKFYLDTLPGGNAMIDNYRDFKFRTSYLADLLPLYGPLKGSGDPLMLLRNRYNSITYVDPMNESYVNKNGLLVGMSGSGKSFLMNNISLSYLAYDPIITIVDKGGSYKKFINSLDGDYFEVSTDDKINPFDIPMDNEKQTLFWQSILMTMIKDDNRSITNDDKIIIEEAVAIAKERDINKPTVSDFVDIIKELSFSSDIMMANKDKIERYLGRWTRGIYGNFLNNKDSNINVSNDILGFDLKGLENYPDILEIFMYYISSICWYKAELDRSRKKLFIFDEVWAMFLTEQGGRLLEEMYRTLRKYGASIWSISQDISDFAGSDYSAGILQNVCFYYILKQSDLTDYDMLKNTFNLSDQNVMEIKNLTSQKGYYSEMFVKTPDLSFIARLVTSAYKYWMATTDSSDIVLYEKMLNKKDNDNKETFVELSKSYPYGAVQSNVNI